MTADKNTRYCFVQLGRSKRNKRNKKRRKRQRIQAEKQRKSEEVKNNFKQVIDQLNELTRTNLLLFYDRGHMCPRLFYSGSRLIICCCSKLNNSIQPIEMQLYNSASLYIQPEIFLPNLKSLSTSFHKFCLRGHISSL